MKSTLKLSLITGLLVATSVAYSGQRGGQWNDCDPMMGPGNSTLTYGMRNDRMSKMDPTRMQAMMDQRHAAIKTLLKITPEQEAAWTLFIDSARPGAAMMAQWPDPSEMAKLTTPERIDQIKSLRSQRMTDMNAAMDKHFDATKALYTALTPEQQKVFDIQAMQGPGRSGKRGPGNAPMQPMAPRY
ncbi:Spy/CpxP family protein refolding chaperone [Rhodoferax antarcticus]|uniref:LTXXQ motif family protein n=1 Tax=Rhodoferax antarcticus ANT.BR TaxID=1111071 RepID=A0A1Q8YIW8_9BURK|nr:Spy/CpxP family protein refolding chaperone [Rhodoferax antarcticus]APW45032.1 hypothetical protein RA876_00070 [Rhodoferax antarcticus]MCW2313734.1 Spy/CpxP family protein refolding chaperone [Rhodoferax antarcticus]OLP07966.1 hypothetical protein BLL52_1064 [Rhodoferax antarcticus ANT.BR]